MLFTSVESHFHPSAVGAPKPVEAHAAIDAFCDKFAAGLADPSDDALLNLFAEDGSWSDPVGGPPPYVGKETPFIKQVDKMMHFRNLEKAFNSIFHLTIRWETKEKMKEMAGVIEKQEFKIETLKRLYKAK